MSNPEKHINTWSMTDVRKYLAGELPAREMHDLEKAALDDPFLTDALEGLASRVNPLDQDLTELRARLDARVNEKKKYRLIPIWMRAAAAVILVAGLGSTAYYYTFQGKSKLNVDTEPQPAAVAKTAPAPATTAPAQAEGQPPIASTTPTAAYAPASIASAHPATASAAPAKATRPAAPAARDESKALDSAAYANSGSVSKRDADADIRAKLPDSISLAEGYAATRITPDNELLKKMPVKIRGIRSDTAQYDAAFAPATQSFARSERFGSRASLVFSGRVLDAGNRPLAGASVFLNGSKNGFLTDGEGKFNVYVAPQDTARMVTVAKLGYEQASYALNTAAITDNIIRLEENKSTLNEVVVSGFGAKRKETLAAPPSDEKEDLDSFWTKTSPVIGRKAYLEYLATAKKGLVVDTAIHGVESISFIVDRQGEYTDFKIERSLSPIHDAALIRLIMEGPAWKPLRRKKARAVVTVSFP